MQFWSSGMAWLKKLSRILDTFMPSQLQQFHPVVERLITLSGELTAYKLTFFLIDAVEKPEKRNQNNQQQRNCT